MKANKLRNLIPLLFIIFVFSCTSNNKSPGEKDDSKPSISVVNYPLYFFAKSIGGDMADVYLPAIGGDPAHWKPEAKQVLHFQNSDLILANGATYAKWMEKVSLPSSKIVNTSAVFKDKWIATDEEVVHSHGPEGEHSHKGTASITWIDFKLALQQANSVYEAMLVLLPEKKDELRENFDQLKEALLKLDQRATSISSQIGEGYIIASHPVYQYFQAGYKFNLFSMHWEPDEMPEPEAWQKLEQLATTNQAKIMIWEAEPIEEIKLKFETIDLSFAVFDVCANRPDEGNFMNVMNQNLMSLERFTSELY